MSTPKRWASTRDLLDFLLLEKTPSEQEVLALINELDEDHLLDFKSGKTPPDKLKEFLRDYLAGFANVSGGTLVIGVTDEQPRKVDGFRAPGREDPASWAAAVVKDIGARLSPGPTFKVATCEGKQVFFMATERASQLVELAENRRLRVPLRLGKHLIRDPQPDIITDLRLGRRARPFFHITGATFQPLEGRANSTAFGAGFTCNIENDSFLHVRNVSIGVVGYTLSPPVFAKPTEKVLQQIHDLGRPSSPSFTRHPADPSNYEWFLRQARSDPFLLLAPFGSEIFSTIGPFLYLPLAPNHAWLQAALYVLAEDSAPTWYQITYEYVVSGWRPSGPYTFGPRPVTITPLFGTRPVVGWRPF